MPLRLVTKLVMGSEIARIAVRHLLVLSLTLMFICVSDLALAETALIFDVKKNLPLDADEEVFHDYYINAGLEVGFKKGTYVTVVRPVPVHDPVQNKQQGTMNVVIGQLHVIHVEKNLAVGRVFSETNESERPTVEFEAVMIGDRVDLDSITARSPGEERGKRATLKGKRSAKSETEPASDEVPHAPASLAPAHAAPEKQPEPKPEPPNKAQPAQPSVPTTGTTQNQPATPRFEESGLRKRAFPLRSSPDIVRVTMSVEG